MNKKEIDALNNLASEATDILVDLQFKGVCSLINDKKMFGIEYETFDKIYHLVKLLVCSGFEKKIVWFKNDLPF